VLALERDRRDVMIKGLVQSNVGRGTNWSATPPSRLNAWLGDAKRVGVDGEVERHCALG